MPNFFAITFIILLAAISPGPDFALVVKNSLQHHRQSGIATALGVSTSLLIHTSYALLGLAIIISQSLVLFSFVTYCGAVYLIFLGIKCLLAKHQREIIAARHLSGTVSFFHSFSQGFLGNLLNPKAIMFILAFFTLIIQPTTSLLMQISYGLEIALIHFIWFSWLAIMITHKRVKKSLNKIEYYIVKIMGLALIGFGVRIAFLRH